MKVTVLASGSKGNATLIESNNKKILIDMGVTYQYLVSTLDEIGYTTKDIDAILITHIHSDHISGLASLIKKTGKKVYVLESMVKKLATKVPSEYFIIYEEKTVISDITINLIHTSHDVDGVGFIIESDNKSIVYITDTGYINHKYLPLMKNKNAYIIESNHDEEMLMKGPYPYILKQRVISDKGHLSNITTANYLLEIVGDNTECIVLAHISEKNNTNEIAYDTTKDLLEQNNINKPILIAKQYESLETIEV